MIEKVASAGSFLDGGCSAPLQRAAIPLLDPADVGEADIFASHTWGGLFWDLVAAILHVCSEDMFVWVDIFAVRQWPGNVADLDFRGVIRGCTALVVAAPVIVGELTGELMKNAERAAFLESEEGAAAKKRRSELAEQVATKIQAAAWVAAGGFVAYQTDLPVVLLAGTETNRFWCDVAAACFAANCVLCFYLTVWLPHVQRIDLEWNVYCPRVIPTMTVLGLTCGFSLIRGLWPVWGLLTPLILGLVAMACLMSLHFIPIPC